MLKYPEILEGMFDTEVGARSQLCHITQNLTPPDLPNTILQAVDYNSTMPSTRLYHV